ncbi:hypothetical protein HKX48_005272, partial [Thoreauomyces humboldtii]
MIHPLLVLGLSIAPLLASAQGTTSFPNSTTTSDACGPFLLPIPFGFVRTPLASCHPSLDCCLPCPATDHLYPLAPLPYLEILLTVVRCVSILSALVIVVSYAVLPGKRKFPRIYILFMATLVVLWQAIGMSYGFGKRGQDVFCVGDGVTSASFETNTVCAVQGVALVWAACATACWCVAFIAHMHLQIAWNSSWLARHRWFPHVVSWGLPSLLAAFAIWKQSIEYVSRGICTVSDGYEGLLVFTPLITAAVLVCSLHTATTVYLWRVARKSRRRIGSWQPTTTSRRGGGDDVSMSGWNGSGDGETGSVYTTNTMNTLATGRPLVVVAKGGTQLEGVRPVQARLLIFAIVLIALAVTYAMFVTTDLGRVSAAMVPTPWSAESTVPVFATPSILTSPLEDLVACIHAAGTSPTSSRDEVVFTCAQSLASSGRIALPELWRRVLAEFVISIGGFCLLGVLGWRLVADWKGWWNARRGNGSMMWMVDSRAQSEDDFGNGKRLGLGRSTTPTPTSTAIVSATNASTTTVPTLDHDDGGGGSMPRRTRPRTPELELSTLRSTPPNSSSPYTPYLSSASSPSISSATALLTHPHLHHHHHHHHHQHQPPTAASTRSSPSASSTAFPSPPLTSAGTYAFLKPGSPGSAPWDGGAGHYGPHQTGDPSSSSTTTTVGHSGSSSMLATSFVEQPGLSLSKSVTEREAFGPQFRP